MSQELIHQAANLGALSTVFAGEQFQNDLGAGVQGGFSLIGYRGKVWSIKHQGTETALMRPDGDGPRGSIEIVVLKAALPISKIWYEKGWEDGNTAPPDCWSSNGIVPDPSSLKKQAPACATCPMNVWGSRITPQGKQGKACQDSKRLAVAPLNDIANELLGGPMLLRTPAASLQDLKKYGDAMGKMGYPYYGIGTRVSFDPAESYPKFVFNPIRVLSDVEARLVKDWRVSPEVTRILAEDVPVAGAGALPAPQQPAQPNYTFEQPPQQAAPQQPAPQPTPQPISQQAMAARAQNGQRPAPQPTVAPPTQAAQVAAGAAFGGGGPAAAPQQPTPQPTAAPQGGGFQQQPAPTAVVGGEFERSLDEKLAALL
jgi:hypothetical protein